MDNSATVTTAEVDAFAETLLGKAVALQARSSTNALPPPALGGVHKPAAVQLPHEPRDDDEEAAAPTPQASEPMTVAELQQRVRALQRENALYQATTSRLCAMLESSSASSSSAASLLSPAHEAVLAQYTAQMTQMAKELAECKATIAKQGAALEVAQEQARQLRQHAVEQQVTGMQSQIDELRYAVRELSVQASQSRAASVRASPPPHTAPAAASAISSLAAQEELMALREIIRQQQQAIVSLQEAAHAHGNGTGSERGSNAYTWQDPDPELALRGTDNLHSPSRASGRVMYAESESSPHPLGLEGGSSSSSVSGGRHGSPHSDEPEPTAPLTSISDHRVVPVMPTASHGKLHYDAAVSADKENICPCGSGAPPPPLAPRRAQVSFQAVGETVVTSDPLTFRQSGASDMPTGGGGSSGTSTPPPRATVVLSGLHGYTLSLDDTCRGSRHHNNTLNLSFASPDDAGKRTAHPEQGEGQEGESAEDGAGERVTGSRRHSERSSGGSSDVSYIGRRPRGAISLSMPRRSFGSHEDDAATEDDDNDKDESDAYVENHAGTEAKAFEC